MANETTNPLDNAKGVKHKGASKTARIPDQSCSARRKNQKTILD